MDKVRTLSQHCLNLIDISSFVSVSYIVYSLCLCVRESECMFE